MTSRVVLANVFSILVLSSTWSFANTDQTVQLKQQVQQLQQQVNSLEKQLHLQRSSQEPTYPSSYSAIDEDMYDPWSHMLRMQQYMNRLISSANNQASGINAFNPRTDIKRTDKEYVVTLDMPGMEKDKIDVQVKDRMLVISGMRENNQEQKQGNQYFSQERTFGQFVRAVALPEDAQVEGMNAKYDNGVLVVTVKRDEKFSQKQEKKVVVQ